jgi:hypothetical protein
VAALELHVDLAPRRLRLVPATDQSVVDGDQPEADQDDDSENDPESHAGGLLAGAVSLVMIGPGREE